MWSIFRRFSTPVFLSTFVCLYLVLLAICSPAGAFCMEYLPLSDAELTLRFKQQLVCDTLMPGNSVTSNRCTVRMTSEGRLHVAGVDHNIRPWSVTALCYEGCASVWTADLDRNGQNDLLLLSRTGGTGWEATSQLMVIMFDSEGRPIPWQCDGYFDVDKRGIRDILDLDYDGRADIVRQSFEKGFWITSLYEAGEGRFKLRQHHGTRSFPIHTKFTYKPNRLPAKCSTDKPCEVDCSNALSASPMESVCLSRLVWPLHTCENLSLLLSNGKKCVVPTSCSTLSVVLDERSGRRIALMSSPEARTLLEEIRVRQIPMAVATKMGRNAPVLIWAGDKTCMGIACRSKPASRSDAYLSNELP